MEDLELTSLFVITCMAFVSPLLATFIPRKVIPETVFLLVAGMLVGPNVAGWVTNDAAINLLSDLGLAFLFLLAGYEIDVKEITGKGGKFGLATWFVTFAIALGIGIPIGMSNDHLALGFAVAIALSTTAFGTLVPILKERNLTDTPVGKEVVNYGVWGELCPIFAITLLLSTRSTWINITLLATFLLVSVIAALFYKRLGREGNKIGELIRTNANTNSQLGVRAVVVLLVGLVTLSAIFDLDIVLGAFAAGFVLRIMVPNGDSSLDKKLTAIGYGFFIPLFFIVSGMSIDPMSVLEQPLVLVVFILALLLVRALPIVGALNISKRTRALPARSKAAISLYCTTALPLIVAVTSVAVSSGAMSQEIASILITAGGNTVLVMPLLALIVMRTVDATQNRDSEESK